VRPWGLRALTAIDTPFSIESMYAHSRLLLRQEFPGNVTEVDTAAVSAVTRSRSAAQHQRQARQALESTDRDADREAAPEDQEGLEASGVGGCRRGRGLSSQEVLQLPCQNGHFGGPPRAATDRHLSRGSAASLGAEPAGDWRR
jgi:hypothetical protein